MSIVGYVLGLGDRHPSNFMIDRNTGDVVHIDFGDCFEVARNRVLFPELIPFRLTRMIVNAFGAFGIEGDFRPVCEKVMMLVRENCNSLVSVLEIFVQEPIHDENNTQLLTEKIMPRIWNKIVGTDFESEQQLTVNQHVELLIEAAMDQYNLANLYSGWCPLW
ncbi:PIKK family atypical protein kinase [Histomonas meleagridis]|uniref:PIKK family atypical protein kinase n=1 Tax=Histomonas meleagridis TaxID=135588 RepID=UPI00355A393D|nr:PIKK family atypical protein kinase [Histomonas meleagridis]KAH0805206.1 PIKK family atypical protein kinase [Histomonas meleagridis]